MACKQLLLQAVVTAIAARPFLFEPLVLRTDCYAAWNGYCIDLVMQSSGTARLLYATRCPCKTDCAVKLALQTLRAVSSLKLHSWHCEYRLPTAVNEGRCSCKGLSSWTAAIVNSWSFKLCCCKQLKLQTSATVKDCCCKSLTVRELNPAERC